MRAFVPTLVLRAALALLLAALAAGPARAAALDAAERRLIAAVERRAPAALALLERLVNENSGTLNLAGVRRVGAMLAPEFESLGFRTRWIDGAPFARAGHLVAERRGAGRGPRPRLLLIGHLDTVFEADSPFQRFVRTSDTTASGPGVTDMKGGDVVMLLALQALADARLLDRLDVTAIFTGDEERPGAPLALARAELVEAAGRADVAIGFEDGDGDPRTALVTRRSSGGWTLRVRATPAHSSQIFREDVGAGAIFEAARILQAFRDSLAGERMLTFNPGVIVGGTNAAIDRATARGTAFGKSNVIAESTVVVGDLRALTPEQRAHAQETMRRIVARTPLTASAEIAFDDSYPPLAPASGSDRLLALYDAASRDLGLGPVTAEDPRKAGGADVSFTSGLTPAALDGVGLMGSGGHTVNEVADLRTLPTQARRMAVMLKRLAAARAR